MQLSAGSIDASKWFVPTWMAQLQLSKPTLLHGFLDMFWAHILVLVPSYFRGRGPIKSMMRYLVNPVLTLTVISPTKYI